MLLIHQVQHIYNLAQIREIYKMVSRKKTVGKKPSDGVITLNESFQKLLAQLLIKLLNGITEHGSRHLGIMFL